MSLFQTAVLQKYVKQQDAACIDALVYQLYGLTEEEVKVVVVECYPMHAPYRCSQRHLI